MLSEDEVRRVIEHQRGFLESIVDPDERRVLTAFISGMELVLNE